MTVNNLRNICPSVRVALDHRPDKYFTLNRRSIFDYELLHIAEGYLEVHIDNRVYQGAPGDFLLFKPGVEHSFSAATGSMGNSCLKNLHLPHIHFDLIYRDDHRIYTSFKPLSEFSNAERAMISPDLTEKGEFCIPEYIKLRDPQPVKELLMKIIKERETNSYGHNLIENGYLLEILGLLLRSANLLSEPQVELNLHRLTKVRNLIQENYNKDVSIDELVKMSGLSKYYFLRVFKKAFGKSPIELKRSIQMSKAEELLIYTDMPITEVAKKVGYNSIHAFSRAFRNVKGTSPSRFNELQRTIK